MLAWHSNTYNIMAKIKPFKGIRPPKELVELVESRPYDVLDSEEARAEAGDNEKSLYHIIKPEINFEPGTSEYDPRVYESAAENFRKFQKNGWLKQDDKEQYYIYAQTMNGKTQYGLVVGAYVNDYMTESVNRSNEIIFRCSSSIANQKIIKHLIIRISKEYRLDICIANTYVLHAILLLVTASQLMLFDNTRHIIVYISTHHKTILSLASHCSC